MAEFKVSSETKAQLDSLCAHAERNGWNAAINACRLELPPEYSFLLKRLYKLRDAAERGGEQ